MVAQKWKTRVLPAGTFLLPLVCLPGLDRPFSTPKLWLIAALDLAVALCFLLQKRAPDWPWLVWLGAAGASALAAPSASMEALLLAVLPLPLCWMAWDMRPILWASALESAIVVSQYCGMDPFAWFGWRPEYFASSRMRVYGTLGNPDFVAAWLCATLPLYAGVEAKERRAWLWAGAAALQFGAVYATGSRVFLLALMVSAAALFSRVRIMKWAPVAALVAAAILWFSPARPLGATIEGRLHYVKVITEHWREVPVLGFGTGSFPVEYAGWQAERPGPSRFAGDLDHAHNDYLETLVEYGPVGLAAFLGLCVWILANGWRTPAADRAVWAAAASLMAIALVDFPFHRPAEWGLFWILLGTLRAASIEEHKRRWYE